MKLHTYTLRYLSVTLLAIISVWAVIFYFNMMDEVNDSVEDGLENYKELIIQKVSQDSTLLNKTEFAESNYSIRPTTKKHAKKHKDVYRDTMIYIVHEKEMEPFRMLTTVFKLNDNEYYELKVFSSVIEEDELMEGLFYSLIWLYIIIIASVYIVNSILLRKIWNPFYDVLKKLKDFKPGEYINTAPLPTKIQEFRELNKTVADLTERVNKTYISQKQFIENAAHELQTPLAIGINKLELLAEKQTLSEPDLNEVSSVLDNLQRLTRLNKTLLLLSRIENAQFTPSENVNLTEVITRNSELFEDFAAFRGIKIELISRKELFSKMNPDLAEILVSNLIKNAIVHNINEGKLEIAINTNSFTITNTGKDSALDKAPLFNRFHRQNTEASGTGLGMAIVKAIADNYSIKIDYHFDGLHHITVSV